MKAVLRVALIAMLYVGLGIFKGAVLKADYPDPNCYYAANTVVYETGTSNSTQTNPNWDERDYHSDHGGSGPVAYGDCQSASGAYATIDLDFHGCYIVGYEEQHYWDCASSGEASAFVEWNYVWYDSSDSPNYGGDSWGPGDCADALVDDGYTYPCN